jgi:exopolysaccharide biosynthesis polyprenyl glycosylphosphotransferase
VPLDNNLNRLIKRISDIIVVTIGIIIISPLLLVTAILVKLNSPGPVIFKQKRVGNNRKEFYIYKFRSMKVQEEEDYHWTKENDPRNTKIGSFIRKTNIDELPQFFNILKGDMSLIGPRPERPYFVDKFRDEIPKYMIKHHVRPGMTGYAQIYGYRGNTSIKKRIEYDIYYVENWNFFLDVKIFFMTFRNFFKNAY